MKAERKIINDILWGYARELDRLNTEISCCNDLIKDLENPLKATSFDGIGIVGSGRGSQVERSVILRDKYNARIEEANIRKNECRQEFEQYIAPLRLECIKFLRMRYIDGVKPREIARKLNYSESTVKHSIGGSLEYLFRYYKKDLIK